MVAGFGPLALAAACAFVALLFLRAGLHKLSDMPRFEGVLADYELAPEGALRAIAFALPVVELLTAGALAITPLRGLAAWAAGGLLTFYALVMAVSLLRGRREIDCGCGGAPEPLSWALVARNAVLAAIVAPAALGGAGPVGLGAGATAWGVALIGFCCWGAVEQLLSNARRMAGDRDAGVAIFGGAQ